MKKLLYSPGYGAGWSTWNDGRVDRYMTTYQPIIDFIEAGGSFSRDEVNYDTSNGGLSTEKMHPLLVELVRECAERFGVEYICVLGAHNLEVLTVSDNTQVRFEEYDGNESYCIADQVEWF